jgi:alkylmercury lyase
MSTDYVERTTTLIRGVDAQELLPHTIRLLAEGEPATLEQLAAAIGWSPEQVATALDQQTSAERDEEGRLVGLALTLRPTPHRVIVDGRTVYAWCATDTLMFPVILGRPTIVESACPQTGRAIRVELMPDAVRSLDPPEAVMTAVRPTGRLTDVRASTCSHGDFFSSATAAADWTRQHPEGYMHLVEEAFRLERRVIQQLGWEAR